MAGNKLNATHVTVGDEPMDEQLAAALEECRKVFANDPERWHNNPEKKRKGLEGLGRVLAEWQAEDGAFAEGEFSPAPVLIDGTDDHRQRRPPGAGSTRYGRFAAPFRILTRPRFRVRETRIGIAGLCAQGYDSVFGKRAPRRTTHANHNRTSAVGA